MNRQIRRMPAVMKPTQHIDAEPTKVPKWVWWLVFLVILGYGAYWSVMKNSYFAIRHVQVEGATDASLTAVANQLVGDNIFSVHSAEIEARLISAYPPARSVDVIRGLPDTVRLAVTLRNPALIWVSGSTNYLVDDTGVVYAVNNPGLPQPSLTVVDTSNLPIEINRQVTTPAFLNFVDYVAKKIPDATGKKIKTINVGQSLFYIDVVTDDNKTFKLTILRDADEQVKSIQQILLAKGGNVGYIDVRVPLKGFYK